MKSNPWAYRILSDTFKEDASLIVAFLNKGKSKSMIAYIPEGVFQNKAAITMILPKLSLPEIMWEKLPSILKSDVELARLIPSVKIGNELSSRNKLINDVLHSCQGARGDEGFWLALVSSERIKILPLLENWASPNILACHDVMIAAAREDSTALHIVDP